MKRGRFKYVAAVFILILIAAIGVGWSVLARGFSAKGTPSSAEAFVARKLRRLAIPSGARDAKNPVPATPDVMSGAMAHFADHCATCHGNDGNGKTLIGNGLYPKPPNMAEAETQGLSDGELYYIIENGVRFTGMPAFGEGTGDEQDKETWELVDFIRHLPGITPAEIAEMKKMNPKGPMELAEEEAARRFLEGDDSPPPKSSEHHH